MNLDQLEEQLKKDADSKKGKIFRLIGVPVSFVFIYYVFSEFGPLSASQITLIAVASCLFYFVRPGYKVGVINAKPPKKPWHMVLAIIIFIIVVGAALYWGAWMTDSF